MSSCWNTVTIVSTRYGGLFRIQVGQPSLHKVVTSSTWGCIVRVEPLTHSPYAAIVRPLRHGNRHCAELCGHLTGCLDGSTSVNILGSLFQTGLVGSLVWFVVKLHYFEISFHLYTKKHVHKMPITERYIYIC